MSSPGRMTYEQTMEWGAAQYADVLAALRREGLSAEFTQTGGMCGALLVTLEGGRYLQVYDAEESLSWDRDAHEGWSVGMYDVGDDHTEPRRFGIDYADGGIEALLAVVERVLRNDPDLIVRERRE